MYVPEHLDDPNQLALRQKLDTITCDPTGYAAGTQPGPVTALRKEMPHSIQCICPAYRWERRSWDYNCHAFSLGFSTREEFWDARPKVEELLPESDFMTILIEQRVLDLRSRDRVQEGDLLLYYSGSELKHSGVVVRGRIRSKWGNGNMWEHLIGEVPLRYGDRVDPFNSPESQSVLRKYLVHVVSGRGHS